MLATLVTGIFLGLPLAFVLGGSAVIFGFISSGPDVLYIMAVGTYKMMTSYILAAVPLFIFMAALLERSGIAKGFFSGLKYLFGPIRGGAGVAAIVVSTLFAACTGVTGAAIMSVGVLALPSLLALNYRKSLSAGIVGSGGTLGILIPPSIMLVMMGAQAGISVGKLFAGAIFPGLLLSVLYITYTLLLCFFRPDAGPSMSSEERAEMPVLTRLIITVKSAGLPMLLIVVVLGSIISGVATPTEASGLGAFLALILMIVMKQFKMESFIGAMTASGRTTAMALLIAAMASCYTSIFLSIGGGELVRSVVFMFGESRWVAFSLMMVITFFLGMFFDWIGIVFMVFPIFLPIANDLGFDTMWFVVVMAINLQASFLSPPFGYALFYLKAISDAYLDGALKMGDIYRGIVPFVLLVMLSIIIVSLFPGLITLLPSFVG